MDELNIDDLQNRIKELEAENDALKTSWRKERDENLDFDLENRELKTGIVKLITLIGRAL